MIRFEWLKNSLLELDQTCLNTISLYSSEPHFRLERESYVGYPASYVSVQISSQKFMWSNGI